MKDIIITGRCYVYGEYHKEYDEITLSEIKIYREILQLKGINFNTLKKRDMDIEEYMKEKLLEIRNNMIDEYRDDIRKELFLLLKKKLEEELNKDKNFLQKLIEGLRKNNNYAKDFFNDLLNRLDSILNCVSHYINCSEINNNYLNEYEVHIKLKGNEDVRLLKVIKTNMNKNKESENKKEFHDL